MEKARLIFSPNKKVLRGISQADICPLNTTYTLRDSSKPLRKAGYSTYSDRPLRNTHLIAATLTLPFDVVKTHKQTELWETDVTSSSQKSTSVWRIMKRIVAENGFTGLFTGIIPRLTKIAPACAIMISTYEYGKSFFHKLNKNREVKNH
ncbi:hypothetical protein JRQ81_018577 [Phrynocephalus forsythii]|uniref:Mitochondrial carrier protein n=1 Tax=Phrynocephalus forsythii TaxID=171643 RepID=A0A9Q0XPV1_9SAUR|nr:hypothetical protein JRQ81_018577 [Phrynocephalus forsythii]